MPADLVEGEDAEDVAAYVAKCAASTDKAACPGVARRQRRRGPLRLARLPGLPLARRLALERADLQGLFGSMVKLANGQTVKADEQYLLESILDPDKQIVKGYQPAS